MLKKALQSAKLHPLKQQPKKTSLAEPMSRLCTLPKPHTLRQRRQLLRQSPSRLQLRRTPSFSTKTSKPILSAPEPPSFRGRRWRIEGFRDAVRGLWILVSTQPNARIHAVATLAVVAAAAIFHVDRSEWCLLILAIALVWVAEGLNTAIEFTVDLVSPERQKLAGWAKDVAAGAVLVASLAAAAIGLIIFFPRLFP